MKVVGEDIKTYSVSSNPKRCNFGHPLNLKWDISEQIQKSTFYTMAHDE
jgi:hypothetical protein